MENKDDRDRLAEFHHTISEQLNSRLSESPQFFGLLIVVATGYGYALVHGRPKLVLLATGLSYVAVLWASWYLAALGYAFRFLQNTQHCIEHELEWAKYTPGSDKEEKEEDGGKPPASEILPPDAFWLLPGIYHAHAFGLCALIAIICGVGSYKSLCYMPTCCAVACCIAAFVAGIAFTFLINGHYVRKFRDKRWQDPKNFDPKKPLLPTPDLSSAS